MMDIFEVLKELEQAEWNYQESKEKLLQKENSLWLNVDWDTLKKERGITTEAKRKAHVQNCTNELRIQVTNRRMVRDNLKRTYTALLWMEKPDLVDVATGTGK